MQTISCMSCAGLNTYDLGVTSSNSKIFKILEMHPLCLFFTIRYLNARTCTHACIRVLWILVPIPKVWGSIYGAKHLFFFLLIPGFFTWQMSVKGSGQQVSFKLLSRMQSDISCRTRVCCEMYKKLLWQQCCSFRSDRFIWRVLSRKL